MIEFEIRQKDYQGLFALNNYLAGQPLFKLNGVLHSKNDNIQITNDFLQIGPEVYLDMSGNKEFFIRHSCSPNTTVKVLGNYAFLVALHNIKKNDELTFDYSLTSTENPNEWSMQCNCKQWCCRNNISGFHTVPKDRQDYYLKLDAVPKYVIVKI